MIEGVLHHGTELEIDRQYVDSHGQSEVAFAFCRLLGFQLLPRLKAIHKQKLYRPEAGKPEEYPDGSVTFLEEERVFLVRKGNTFRCLSAICTHLGCTVNRTSQGYHCPCHGSFFDDQGGVKSGPAPRSLEWFSVTLSKDSRLLVDKSQRVNPDKYLVL